MVSRLHRIYGDSGNGNSLKPAILKRRGNTRVSFWPNPAGGLLNLLEAAADPYQMVEKAQERVSMSRKVVISVALLGVAYALLLALVTPYANFLIKIPEWWYPTFGQSNLSALVWLHLVNGVFVIVCAAPVSATIVRMFPQDWARTATWVGVLASVMVLAPTFYRLPGLIDAAISLEFVPSLVVDLLKYAFFPLIISMLIRYVNWPRRESSA